MPSLEKTHRNQLERAVKEARDIAEAGAKAALETLGVGDAGPPSYLDDDQRNLRRRLRIHGRQLGDLPDEKKKTQEIERLIEEVAYEHWHRMLFARFLAENNLLMYPDPHSPVAVSLVECEDLAADEGARNGWELAARFAARMLPQIFRVDSPVFELELPPERQQQLEKLISNFPPEVFTASDSLGWVYQFWQANRKKQINESEVKIGGRELPAVTQLFTEDYMVDFLLDNTLGAWWAGKREVKSFQCSVFSEEGEVRNAVALAGCSWNYLRFVPVDADASSLNTDNRTLNTPVWRPAAGTFDGWPRAAKEFKCLDPCMGSGHFVVGMFERLVALRMAEEQLDENAAVKAVIRDNLFGLELDPRCTQIAAFNLALAAWRRVGYCILPPMNLACSGLAPNTSKEEWLVLAGENEKFRNGMERLFDLFEQAPVLGSLINPRGEKGDLLEASYNELQPLLEQALSQEALADNSKLSPENYLEMAVTARGLAKAAEILACQFTLVATNVPYLGRNKQENTLADYCAQMHPDAKSDLATCCVERCITLCSTGGSTALVTPQNWLFLGTYKRLRQSLLSATQWDCVVRLGEGGFDSSHAAGAFAALLMHTCDVPSSSHAFAALDASDGKTPEVKSCAVGSNEFALICQESQLSNPDARITTDALVGGEFLAKLADYGKGSTTGDRPRFLVGFWELAQLSASNTRWLDSPNSESLWSGREHVTTVLVQSSQMREQLGCWLRGQELWGRLGVAVNKMRGLQPFLYAGETFDDNIGIIAPRNRDTLLAIWAFIESGDHARAVRRIDQKLNVTAATLTKVPFDLLHWQKVASEKFPHGLPKPFSSDPTQWLFNGHPHGSDNPLQVVVARLVGYEWPRQTGSSFPDCPALGPDGLENLADKDGIVCIPPVRGEAGAADRLLNLLATAYGNDWSSDVLGRLLSNADYAGKSLETWLRDGFFQQHCELFHQRPFVWHIWDGLRDGFSALVNYHKLDRELLDNLTHNYLGDWINRCQLSDKDSGLTEDGEKTTAAKNLKRKLELILAGEAPYDIFIRWKPLHQQPLGWEPDINDGVRMNIRPFVSVPDVKAKGAGILRVKPKIKWEKDRGKEPQRPQADYPWFWGWDEKTTDSPGGPEFKGERFNDCHYTLACKRTARESQK